MEDAQIIELFFARSEDAISELDKKYGKRPPSHLTGRLRVSSWRPSCSASRPIAAWMP